MKLTTLLKWGTVILMALVLVGGLTTTPGVSAQTGAPDEAITMNGLTGPQSLPVVQVTTDPAADTSPALVQTADGKLLTVFVRNGELWSHASTDGGTTWGTETQIAGCCLHSHSLARADGDLWLAYDLEKVIEIEVEPGIIEVVVKREIWYRTSTDGGVTWAAERQLPTDSNSDYNPIMFQAADHKLWIVWQSDRTGNRSIWFKTSADGGATWSADAQLTAEGYAPTATATLGGRVAVVYNRGDDELWQISSGDNGVTWSIEKRVTGCCRRYPIVAVVGGVLWLAYENDGDIWYRTSTNQGTTWSAEAQFTRFMGPDGGVALVALMSGEPGFVWSFMRSGNLDIWFGNSDLILPPYIEWIEHWPLCDPDSDDTITFRALALDETGVASVHLVWMLNGVAQTDLLMFDDGSNGDDTAGDAVWGVRHAALPRGSQVTYGARATDTDGNTYLYPGEKSLMVSAPFAKTADILFVPDRGGGTSGFRSYYTNALDVQGYKYDTWDTEIRCAPDSTILNQYITGTVIWAVPYGGYIAGDSNVRMAVQSYLDAGGKLFITGQDVAYYARETSFLHDYLHASYVQDDPGFRTVTGMGLTFGIAGGDGANNQSYPDEVDPIVPAETIFAYQAGADATLVEPARTKEETPTTSPDVYRDQVSAVAGALLQSDTPVKPATSAPSAPASCIGSCTAGLFVDTGMYKVIYFAFGFEAINSAAHRACVMSGVLGWLNDTPSQPCLLTPTDGQTIRTGDVTFSWTSMPEATGYQIQIEPDGIMQIVPGTSYTHSFATLGTRSWRVRALPDGGWTAAGSFSISSAVVQVTTDPADDTAPALVQTADGELLTVFVRDGALWSRTSTDGGATWASEVEIAGCCNYNPSLARMVDGKVWLAYDRDGNIWYRSSADHGVTWGVERQLPSEESDDYDPVIFQAADGKLWIVWSAVRYGYYRSIWYKTSANGGDTWSTVGNISSDDYGNDAPTAAVTPDGRVVVVWSRYGEVLRQRSSGDGGVTWSDETQIVECCGHRRPSLVALDDILWLVYARNGDIWYRTSTDDGGTWSDESRFTRFVGGDNAPGMNALASGGVGIVWQSDRSSNPDIWFGIPGEREDLTPPPYIEWLNHRPAPNPDSDDPITFRVRAMDETDVAGVRLQWALDGVAQDDLVMYDNGTHGDDWAGDGVWSVEHAALPEGSQVTYQARTMDGDGNGYRYPGLNSFKVLSPFVKTAATLFVPDAGGNNTPNDTTWFRSYYTNTLDVLGYRYDTWDTGLRGEPGSAILNLYTHGAVIWAVPYRGYATDGGSGSIGALQAYLDDGGRLFITGQNIAESLYWTSFLRDYLHATYRQGDTGLYALAGVPGDPIGDGLALNISGGDGANDQYSKDEVDPIVPAQVAFTYRAGASAMLTEPIRPLEEAPVSLEDANRQPLPDESGIQQQSEIQAKSAASGTTAPEANIGSGTADPRVDTGVYKVVYFAFGFEAINGAPERATVMERVLNWLEVSSRSRCYLPLVTKGD